MRNFDARILETLLGAVGDHLVAQRVEVSVVIVGGAALALGGWIDRTTQDVDVLALAHEGEDEVELARPIFPAELQDAILRVARDFDVPEGWFNDQVGLQWETGLPSGANEGLNWRAYGGLRVGLASRQTLLELKLAAAADGSPDSKHTQDLIAMAPTDAELASARVWVVEQDALDEFAGIVDEVIEHVSSHRRNR